MAARKKIMATVAAVATSAALLVGGTLAWQSTNQLALNEASDIVNPGGRLHDDFDGENKDVYVENFAEEDIFARIRLEEFFEVVQYPGSPAETVHSLIGTRQQATDENGDPVADENGDPVYEYQYVIHKFTTADNAAEDAGVAEDGTAWWTWDLGGSTDFMPTFNKNKDSLAADVNGVFNGAVGTITEKDGKQYSAEGGSAVPYVEYTAGDEKTANAIYDIDSNTLDELADADINALIDPAVTDAANYTSESVQLVSETHTAAATGNAQLISMAGWLQLLADNGDAYDPDTMGSYWVYDEDGWVYWSAPIEPDTATGLLLDGIKLNQVMDDSWYYAINVVAQFVTADDVGVNEGTGFYNEDQGVVPSADAETLLKAIGVQYEEIPPVEPDHYLELNFDGSDYAFASAGEVIKLIALNEAGEDITDGIPENLSVKYYSEADGADVEMPAEDYTFNADDMTITFNTAEELIVYIYGGDGSWGTVELNYQEEITNYADMHVYISTPDSDLGSVEYIQPGNDYKIIVDVSLEELTEIAGDLPENFDITACEPVISLEMTDMNGDSRTLQPGTDYTISNLADSSYVTFSERKDTAGDDYYAAMRDITLMGEDVIPYGANITVSAGVEGYESLFVGAESKLVSDEKVETITVDLYDADGDKVTGNTVKENSVYDVVVTLDHKGSEYVLYSSNDAIAAVTTDGITITAANIIYTHQDDAEPNFEIDSSDGKLHIGTDVDPNVDWEIYGKHEYVDDLTISFCVDHLKVDNGDGTFEHLYVYGEKDVCFEGEEPLVINIDATGSDENNIPYIIGNAAMNGGINITTVNTSNAEVNDVVYTITGAASADNRVENGKLILGADETAERLTITAEKDGYYAGKIEVNVIYATIMVASDGEPELVDADTEYSSSVPYTFSIAEGHSATWDVDNANTYFIDNVMDASNIGEDTTITVIARLADYYDAEVTVQMKVKYDASGM